MIRGTHLRAHCSRFTLIDQPGAAKGVGWCLIYEKPVAWDESSVLFVAAPEQRKRRDYVEKMTNQEKADVAN